VLSHSIKRANQRQTNHCERPQSRPAMITSNYSTKALQLKQKNK